MSARTELNSWADTVAQHLPHLSRPQAWVLALWSFGMVMTRSCGLTTVVAFLASLLDRKEDAVRQQLREWYRDAKDKKGQHRETIAERLCFAPLLKWVLAWWASDERRIALAMDATTLGERFVVLVISVLYRGCAIPIAWTVIQATEKGSWKPHWLALFDHLRGSIPADWCVLVLADRGLYAHWLYHYICSLGWHPFLRINTGGKFRPEGASEFRPLSRLVSQVGVQWSGRVTCFKHHPIPGTLLVRWKEGQSEPWVILTDLTPEQAEVCWYSLRPWIECGFKDVKRGGWQWQQTRIQDPARAARFWLAIAVATLWVVSVGGEADATLPASTLNALPETHIARRRTTHRSRPRLLSCFRRGCLIILTALLKGLALPRGRFYPEPWPNTT